MKKTSKRTIVERAMAGIMAILMIITMCPETLATALAAETTYKLSGIVKYNGNGVGAVKVIAKRKESSDAELSVDSNSDGSYEITGLKDKSNYEVSIVSEDYQGNTDTVYVNGSNVEWNPILTLKGSTPDPGEVREDQTISWASENYAESLNCFGSENFSVLEAKTEVVYTVYRDGKACSADDASIQGNTVKFLKAGKFKVVAQAKEGSSGILTIMRQISSNMN